MLEEDCAGVGNVLEENCVGGGGLCWIRIVLDEDCVGVGIFSDAES